MLGDGLDSIITPGVHGDRAVIDIGDVEKGFRRRVVSGREVFNWDRRSKPGDVLLQLHVRSVISKDRCHAEVE